MTEPDAQARGRVQRLAARGVAAPLIHVLAGQGGTLRQFQRAFAHELKHGAAEADAAVSEAIFDLALSGKSPPVMLAWAKQRLGWTAGEDERKSSPHPPGVASAADAVAALAALMEQVAAAKAGGTAGADELAEAGPSQPAAPAGG